MVFTPYQSAEFWLSFVRKKTPFFVLKRLPHHEYKSIWLEKYIKLRLRQPSFWKMGFDFLNMHCPFCYFKCAVLLGGITDYTHCKLIKSILREELQNMLKNILYFVYSLFHKTLPKCSLLMHRFQVRFYEMGDR